MVLGVPVMIWHPAGCCGVKEGHAGKAQVFPVLRLAVQCRDYQFNYGVTVLTHVRVRTTLVIFPKAVSPQQQNWGNFKLRVQAYP